MPRHLPAEVKVAVVLLKLAGRSTVEIQAELGVSDWTVKTYGKGLRPSTPLNRGRRRRGPAECARLLAAWGSCQDRESVARRFGFKSVDSARSAVNRIRKGGYGLPPAQGRSQGVLDTSCVS